MSEEPKMRDIGKQIREEAFSIPNLLSYFRLLLIPLFVVLYVREEFASALITLAASGLSDILDGRIARKFNMVTDLGKVLDPVADKLTQCAMMFCVAMRFPAMWWLLGLHVVKEIVMLGMGWYVLKKTDTVNSAIWVGKLCTGVIYAVYFSYNENMDADAPLIGVCPEDQLPVIQDVIMRVQTEWTEKC